MQILFLEEIPPTQITAVREIWGKVKGDKMAVFISNYH